MGLRTMLGLKKRKLSPSRTELTERYTPENYWQRRQSLAYYTEVRAMCARIVPQPRSVLDVGSRGCPHLDWFPDAERRVSIDIEHPYAADGVESITADFLTLRPEACFDLCLCLQVLEHIPDAQAFAQHLLAVSRELIISVPYMWPEGATEQHCQDPVDEAKVLHWFGREPVEHIIVQEPSQSRKSRRLICRYRALV